MVHPRLRPYFKLIRHVRAPFIGAVLCGIIYGLSSGFGLPFMTKTIFPLLFSSDLHGGETGYYVRLSDDSVVAIEWRDGWYPTSPALNWTATNTPPVEAFTVAPMTKIGENRDKPKLLSDPALPEGRTWILTTNGQPAQMTGPVLLAPGNGKPLEAINQDGISPSDFILGLGLEHWQLILVAVGLVPITFAVRGLSAFLNVYLINYSGLRVLEEIRKSIFARLQEVEISFFTERPQGDLMSRLFNDTTQLQHSVVNVANDLIKQPVTFLGAMGFLIYTSIQKSEIAFILFSLAIIPICVIPIRYAGKKLLKKALHMQIHTGTANALVQENISGHREVRAFNLQEREKSRFQKVISDLFREQMKIVKYSSFLSPTIEFISACGVSAAIFYAAGKGITLEDFTPLVMALYLSYEPVKKLGAIHSQVKKGLASLDRIEEIVNQPIQVTDPASPTPFPNKVDHISFDHVGFSYGEDKPVLRDISLRANMGDCIAIVGPSGAGKSTLIQLLCRFYDPSNGQISINGSNIREFRQCDLRKHISLVSQDTTLFNDSIENNIRLGDLDASEEDILKAAEQAQALDFIQALPDGFQTIIGEKGSKLSGGQKQRLSIARAFLRDAPIIIFDEATSALDTENESRVQMAMNRLVTGKLSFVIAHRLSTVKDATTIIVMDAGVIESMGTHTELLSSSPLYSQLVEKQSLL